MNKSDIIPSKSEIKIGSRSPLTSQHSQSPADIYLSESSYASTNYQRYISRLYIREYSQYEYNDDENRKEYWNIVTRSVLYLKRQLLNESLHDELLLQTFKRHFDLQKLDPSAKTQIGKSLLSSGYFLAAYAILLARLRKKGKAVIDYFRIAFQKNRIIYGLRQLNWYLSEEYPCTAKIINQSKQDSKIKRQSPIARISTCDSIPCDDQKTSISV